MDVSNMKGDSTTRWLRQINIASTFYSWQERTINHGCTCLPKQGRGHRVIQVFCIIPDRVAGAMVPCASAMRARSALPEPLIHTMLKDSLKTHFSKYTINEKHYFVTYKVQIYFLFIGVHNDHNRLTLSSLAFHRQTVLSWSTGFLYLFIFL